MVLSVGEALTTLRPLLLFVIGMVVYAIFIFKFYLFIARRDIIQFNIKQYSSRAPFDWLRKIIYVLYYILEYIILFPIFVAVWFVVFGLLLMVLTPEQSLGLTLLTAMAIVTTVRITSYYNEDLSKDLAKMLPFALLGVLLIDISFFSPASALDGLREVPGLLITMIYYLIFTTVVEFILRIFALLFKPNTGPEEFKPK